MLQLQHVIHVEMVPPFVGGSLLGANICLLEPAEQMATLLYHEFRRQKDVGSGGTNHKLYAPACWKYW